MPFKSLAQAAYFNIHRKELERQGVNVDEWNSASKGLKLPKRAKKKYQIGGDIAESTSVKLPLPINPPILNGVKQIKQLPIYKNQKQTKILKDITGNPIDSVDYLTYRKILGENGTPNLHFDTSIDRSNYNPYINRININSEADLLGEAAHSQQFNNQGKNVFVAAIKDWLKNPYFNTVQRENQYDTPGTTEYDAHRTIEPNLYNQYIHESDSIADRKQKGQSWYKVGGKYQFGGDNGLSDEDNSFFDTLLQAANQKQQEQQDEYLDPSLFEGDNSADTTDNTDYSDIQNQLSELKDLVTKQGQMFNRSNDEFVNMLFQGDNNNEPIIFGDSAPVNPDEQSQTTFNYNTNLRQSGNKGFRSFGSYEEGRNALENQLRLYQTGETKNPVTPNSSIYQAMSVYAPASDGNNPKHYAEFVADKLGVSPNTPISQIDIKKWADAVTQMEGNKKGNNPGNLRQTGGIANNSEELYNGLNNSDLTHMILNLPNTCNTIRGLDSGKVLVMDSKGKQNILHNNKQTTKVKGRAYEIRLK